MTADHPGGLNAVYPGHTDVHQDQVGLGVSNIGNQVIGVDKRAGAVEIRGKVQKHRHTVQPFLVVVENNDP